MKRLPKLKIYTPDEGVRTRLAGWLVEREMDMALAAPMYPLTFFYPEKAGEPVEPGQIRLLFPSTPAAAEKLCYLAVLRKDQDGYFDVAPFGRYAQPATPGEWLTGLTARPVRVLCLWNVRHVSEDTLAQSWRTDCFSEAQLEKALAVWQQYITNEALLTTDDDDIGPPLVSPLDPRHDYLEEERRRMDSLIVLLKDAAEVQLKAAESKPAYGSRHPFAAFEDYRLTFVRFRENTVRCEVLGPDGLPTTRIDGWCLMNADQTFSETILQGVVDVPASWMAGCLFLCDPAGTCHALELH